MGITMLAEGGLQLRIDPRPAGGPWLIDVTSLTRAIDEANRLIAAC